MDQYYYILGLNPGASDTEIKKAYRQLARKYHPDVSSEPDAEERFIEVTAAYEYLLERKSRPVMEFVYSEPEPDPEDLRRERARRFAQMRYEQFRKETMAFRRAWYYTPLKIVRLIVVVALYAVAVGMFFSPVLAWYITHNSIAVFGFAFIAIVSSQVYVLAREIYKGTDVYFKD
jgi:hypothetical protein